MVKKWKIVSPHLTILVFDPQRRVKMTKQEVIEAFNQGRTIRITSGIWNSPQRDGRLAKSVEEIEKFY